VEKHVILGGKARLFKRSNSKYWQCAASIDGQECRASTRKAILSEAEIVAEEWYFDQRAGVKLGKKKEKAFAQAYNLFERDFLAIASQRNDDYVNFTLHRLKKFVLPFMGDHCLSEVGSSRVQEYRLHRRETFSQHHGREISRSALDKDIIAIRQVLKAAARQGWISHVPDISEPFRKASKIKRRAWFSQQEYRTLYEATRRRVRNPIHNRHKWAYAQLHDFVLFMANTGLRPDEAKRLTYRNIEIVQDKDTDETILLIEVQRGKRGVGYCKSTRGAVRPFERLLGRNNPKQDDLVFPGNHRNLFNTILEEEGLKVDDNGQKRTAYSLRHTYICFRLMEGVDLYQIAKNCRTSVKMIEKHYAAHIQNTLNAAAINVTRKYTAFCCQVLSIRCRMPT